MGSGTLVEAARRALGPVGAFLPVPTASAPPIDLQRDAARRLERAGYRAAWTNETVGGKDALVQLAVLMAATERMVFGTGIANIWARSAQTMHGAAALLAQAFGANGPKMLALAGEITNGALPASQPPEFTAQAGQVLGPGKLRRLQRRREHLEQLAPALAEVSK
jgi:hypothetical protein